MSIYRVEFPISVATHERLVWLSPPIGSNKQYFDEEKRLAEFLVHTYPHFRRFQRVGVVQGWIRDEEFTPHIAYDLQRGYTPHLGAVHQNHPKKGEGLYLKTVVPPDQVARMNRSERMQSAWGSSSEHRSLADVWSAFVALFMDKS